MNLSVDGDELKLTIRWRDIRALLRSLQALIIALGAWLSAPSLVKLGQLLGWW